MCSEASRISGVSHMASMHFIPFLSWTGHVPRGVSVRADEWAGRLPVLHQQTCLWQERHAQWSVQKGYDRISRSTIFGRDGMSGWMSRQWGHQFETHGLLDYYDNITGSSVLVSTTGTVQKHSSDRARAAKLPKAWPGLRFQPPEWLQSSSQLDSRRLIHNITSNSSGTKC